jgi:hypothetical protein
LKFEKTVGLLERSPLAHMVRGESDTAQFQEALGLILGTDLPIAWKAERAEYAASYALVLEAEAKAEAKDKVGLRFSVHPPHPQIAILHVRWPSAPECFRNPPICT